MNQRTHARRQRNSSGPSRVICGFDRLARVARLAFRATDTGQLRNTAARRLIVRSGSLSIGLHSDALLRSYICSTSPRRGARLLSSTQLRRGGRRLMDSRFSTDQFEPQRTFDAWREGADHHVARACLAPASRWRRWDAALYLPQRRASNRSSRSPIDQQWSARRARHTRDENA